MSEETYTICERCWRSIKPTPKVMGINDGPEDRCCSCSRSTSAGIYIKEDPKTLMCGGRRD